MHSTPISGQTAPQGGRLSLAAPASSGGSGRPLGRALRFRGAFRSEGPGRCPGCQWWTCLCEAIAAGRGARAAGARPAAAQGADE